MKVAMRMKTKTKTRITDVAKSKERAGGAMRGLKHLGPLWSEMARSCWRSWSVCTGIQAVPCDSLETIISIAQQGRLTRCPLLVREVYHKAVPGRCLVIMLSTCDHKQQMGRCQLDALCSCAQSKVRDGTNFG